MINLLHAGYRRMFHSKLLYFLCSVMFLIVFFYSLALYVLGISQGGGNGFASTDNFVLSFPSIALIPTIGMAIYIFGANLIGKDFEFQTIKNKIIIGNSKIKIYLVHWILVFSAGMLFYLAYYFGVLTVGMALVGKPFRLLYAFDVLKLLGYQVLLVLTYASVVTSICHITKNKTVSVILLLVSGVVLMTLGYSIIDRLNEPEFWKDYETGQLIVNSGYIKPGFLRSLLTFVVHFFPSCSSCYFMLSTGLSEIPLLEISIYAIVFIVLFSVLGLYIFHRSDLK